MLVDANILLFAVDESSPFHSAAAGWLIDQLNGPARVGFPWQCLGAFMRILLPLVAPGLVATSVFAFITSWNEYIFARTLLNDQSKQTVTVWLSYFLGTGRQTDWGALMAASTLTAIPVVLFFLLVQKRIAFGLTRGAVKG